MVAGHSSGNGVRPDPRVAMVRPGATQKVCRCQVVAIPIECGAFELKAVGAVASGTGIGLSLESR